MNTEDRGNFLLFWNSGIDNHNLNDVVYRFSRVAFNVSNISFVLNATIKHHVETWQDFYAKFVKEFVPSVCSDDISLEAENVYCSRRE